MPPVAKTTGFDPAETSARESTRRDPATVVAAQLRWATKNPKLFRLAFSILIESGSLPVANCSISFSVNPSTGCPATIPITAGTAPWTATAWMQARIVSILLGCGKPCETTVVSSATTGLLSSRALATSSAIRTFFEGSGGILGQLHSALASSNIVLCADGYNQ